MLFIICKLLFTNVNLLELTFVLSRCYSIAYIFCNFDFLEEIKYHMAAINFSF